ncbi:MAG TPA: FkbM family methyltransferase [Planktothrix sp.]|jgi:FkbM family methyltransferase
MNPISDLRNQFANGKIDKPTYISKMFDLHKTLFEYAEYLPHTEIEKIEISNGSVILTAANSGLRFYNVRDDKRTPLYEILNFLALEREEMQMMQAMLNDGDTIFDIGAHLGWYSIHFAQKFPNCKIYAFEPIPSTHAFLLKSIDLNKSIESVRRIKVSQLGLSNETGEKTFYFYPEGMSNASMENVSHHGNPETVKCSVSRMDDFVKQQPTGFTIDFIKCDVEGAEYLVFQGGAESLAKMRPIVFTEMLRKWSAGFNYHPNELIEFMKRLGYQTFVIHDGALSAFDLMTDDTVETNYFFLHREKHDVLIKRLAR